MSSRSGDTYLERWRRLDPRAASRDSLLEYTITQGFFFSKLQWESYSVRTVSGERGGGGGQGLTTH